MRNYKSSLFVTSRDFPGNSETSWGLRWNYFPVVCSSKACLSLTWAPWLWCFLEPGQLCCSASLLLQLKKYLQNLFSFSGTSSFDIFPFSIYFLAAFQHSQSMPAPCYPLQLSSFFCYTTVPFEVVSFTFIWSLFSLLCNDWSKR